MRTEKNIRGMGLANTLMLGALMVTAGFAATSQCVSHLTISNRLDNLARARGLAEAAAEMALAKALANPAFGTTGSADDRSLEISFPGCQGTGRVTFDSARANQWQIPASHNNLTGKNPTGGYQRTVPSKGMQVLAEGRINGVSRLVEGVVYLPPYKYALASSGNISSTGGLQVLGVKDPQAVAGGVNAIPKDQLLPGNVASNGKGNHSLQLDSSALAPSLISGDAQSCGTVNLGPATTVEGAVKQNFDAAALPQIKVEDFDPATLGSTQTLSQATYTSQLTVSGLLRRQGDLTVTAGGLNVDGGYLYVQGNVEVWGGLQGKGALFATGNVKIHGVSTFSASSEQALLCKGDLTIDGLGQNASTFQGLMYTEGDFQASDLTLLGAFMGNKKTGNGTAMILDKVNAVQNPQAVSFNFKNPIIRPSNIPPTVLNGGLGGFFVTVEPEIDLASFYNPATDSFDATLAQSATMKYTLLTPQFTTNDLNALKAAYLQAGGTFNDAQFQAQLAGVIQYRKDELKSQIDDVNKLYQKTRLTSLVEGSFSLDPNQFIQLSDQMRKLLWREIQ